MELATTISEAARDVLLGISAYVRPRPQSPYNDLSLDSPIIERLRTIWNGGITPPVTSQKRWYQADLETAERAADQGDLRKAAELMFDARKDGHLAGVLSTRTDGLVRLPKQFRGDPELVKELELGHESTRSVFDAMFPPSELALMAADGELLGVAVGEFLPVRGRRYPVLVRLEPQFLRYIWSEDQWYYHSFYGLLPITPGDGRWMLHTPGGRQTPWAHGLWKAIGTAYIRKQHALLHRDNWEAKLANPARVAVMPEGSGEEQKDSVFKSLMAWGINSVFGLPRGYDVKLIESNGRGWESFNETIKQCNEEYVLSIAGQTVTTTGGTGFANQDVHKSIRADLIKGTADGLAFTINTQGLPVYVLHTRGVNAILNMSIAVGWDVTPPKDRNAEASAMVQVAAAITQLTTALAPADLQPNVQQLVDGFGIPVLQRVTDDVTGGAGDIEDTALNGAQIASLLEVVIAAAAGQIPRSSAAAIIERAFQLDPATAERLLGDIGQGFTPAAGGAAAATPTPPVLPPPGQQEAA